MVTKALPHAKKTVNNHGGATAIGGFVYQILATTNDQITAESFAPADHFSDTIIYVHEALDQDAAKLSRLSNAVTLIQVKYSSHGTLKQIAPNEMRDIGKALLKAAKLAIKEGLKVTGYKLLSNRGLSPLAQKKIVSLRAINKKKKFKPKNPTRDGILGELKKTTISEADVRKNLESFGQSFGLRANEIEDGIHRLTGKIFAGVARDMTHAMSKSDLIEVFTGNKKAEPLVHASMKKRLEAELAKMTGGENLPHTPRDHMRRLLDEHPYRALFVFLGPGGMGKSSSLQYLVEQQMAFPHGGLVRAATGSNVPIGWAAACIDDWRGNSRFPSPDFPEALERLKIANLDVEPPILTLALDGLDEGVKEQHADYIRTLIRELVAIDRESRSLAGKPPKVRLFVTCREETEIIQYLDKGSSGFETQIDKDYREVEFGAFTHEEFWSVVDREQPSLIDSIFQIDNRIAGLSGFAASAGGGFTTTSPVFKHLEFLQDPLIWRAFTLLDDSNKKAILDGKPTGETKLGLKLLERFYAKTVERRRWNRPKDLPKVLKFLTTEFQKSKKPRNRSNWLVESAKPGYLGPDEQYLLFDEALSGGLIKGGADSWEWRHRVIEKALEV